MQGAVTPPDPTGFDARMNLTNLFRRTISVLTPQPDPTPVFSGVGVSPIQPPMHTPLTLVCD
jgi:hypothetical protein